MTLAQVLLLVIAIEGADAGNTTGDNGKAHGMLQMHKIMVDEVNRIERRPVKRWKYADRLDRAKSVTMAMIFLRHQAYVYNAVHGEYPTPLQLVCSWNSGSILKPMPEAYRRKAEKLMENKECSVNCLM